MATITDTVTTANMASYLKDKVSSVKATPIDDIPNIIASQREYFETGATRSLSFRKEQIRKLYYLVHDNTEEFIEALRLDVGKPRQEAFSMELSALIQDILNVVRNVDGWAKEEYVPVAATFKLSKCRIRKEPLGVVLVMGPWNFPIWCTLCPVLGVIAAGNTVVLKPSEHAPHTAELLAKLVAKYFDPEFFTVVNGAVPVASALLNEKYDHIVYTGGSHGARFVTLAAAKTLTPYTLELGGKNPCVVDLSVNDTKLELYANRIMWGKFCNAGQLCIGSDHLVLIGSPEQEEKFLSLAKKVASAFSRGGNMARIVNEAHFDRLSGLLKQTKGQVIHGGELERDELKIGITIVQGVTKDDSLMSDEIFGPLLPVMRADNLDQAISLIRQSETPLAMYIFSPNRSFINTLLEKCPSGAVTINDTLMHSAVPNLPFGGVGASGVGYYRGKYGFVRFSHLRSITETPTFGFMEKILSSRYPPYTPERLKKMQQLVGDPTPPFSTREGSAERAGSLGGWVYAAGAAVLGVAGGLMFWKRGDTVRLN